MSGPDGSLAGRVAVLGPVTPFRGGIAQHTTALVAALREHCEVELLSFSRLYPRLLFPGDSDRDPALEGQVVEGARYVVDSIRPASWRRAADHLVDSGAAALVMPWWTFFLAPCIGSIARRVARRGVPVVFLCHNVVDHEAAWWKRWLAARVLRLGSGWVVQLREEAAELQRLVPGSQPRFHQHPTYSGFLRPRGTLARRAQLELLFFGFIRPYKGLDVLIEAMGLLAGEDLVLTVAGEAWDDISPVRERAGELGVAERIEFLTRYLPEDEVAELFDRADVAVFPYRSATGSGAVALAQGYGRPVIVTRVGGLPEVVEDGVTGRVVPPEDPAALAGAVRSFMADRGGPMRPAVERFAKSLTWDSLARAVLDTAGLPAR